MEIHKGRQFTEVNQMKYSAMLIELAKPYLSPYPTIGEYEENDEHSSAGLEYCHFQEFNT